MANPVDPALIAALRDAVGPAITSIAVILLFGGPLAIMLVKDRRKKGADSSSPVTFQEWLDLKARVEALEREQRIVKRIMEGSTRNADLPGDD